MRAWILLAALVVGPALADTPTSTTAAAAAQNGAQKAKILPPTPLDYPAEEKAAGHEGTVVAEITIGADGSFQGANLTTSSGFPELDAAALKAMASWHYAPARNESGQPIASSTPARVTFRRESRPTNTEGVELDKFLKDPCSKVTAEATAFRAAHPQEPIKNMYRFKLMTGLLALGTSVPVEKSLALIKLLPATYDEVLVRCEKTPDAIFDTVMADAMKSTKR